MSCFKITNKKTNTMINTPPPPPTGEKTHQRQDLEALLNSDITTSNNQDDDVDISGRDSSPSGSTTPYSGNTSPYYMSPYQASPYAKSPWITQQYPLLESLQENRYFRHMGLIGSLFREEGNIYALATAGDLLYTGSESKNIRVWKNLEEFSGFKSNSGLVKAIVVVGEKIFTGHQDGKIRVWKSTGKKRKSYKRVGSLPTMIDYLASSINPNNYVQVRRNQNVPWIKHFDTVSCMAIDADGGLLYSGSWDKSLKIWRLSDSKCIESVNKAHDDAVNAVIVGFDGLIFTGSADGTVKVWKKELVGNHIEHVLVSTLLNGENAVTSLAVNLSTATVYAGASDGLVNFWEGEEHFFTQGGILKGHTLAVLCLAVGGRLVVSGSADKSICVWRKEDVSGGAGGVHTLLTVLTGHGGPVKCLAIEQERDDNNNNEELPPEKMGSLSWLIYSGSLDKSVKIWRVFENVEISD